MALDDWFKNAPQMSRIERDLYNLSGRFPNSYLNRLRTAGFDVTRLEGGFQVTKDGHVHAAFDGTPRPAEPGEGSRWSNKVYQKILEQGLKGTYSSSLTMTRRQQIEAATANRQKAAIAQTQRRRGTSSPTPEGIQPTPAHPKFIVRSPSGERKAGSIDTSQLKSIRRNLEPTKSVKELIREAAFAPDGPDTGHLKAKIADRLHSVFGRHIPDELTSFGHLPIGDTKSWFQYGQLVSDFAREHPDRLYNYNYIPPEAIDTHEYTGARPSWQVKPAPDKYAGRYNSVMESQKHAAKHREVAARYEGLDDIVKEATQTTAISAADIGAEIDHNTKKIVGGISSYIEEPAFTPADEEHILKQGKRTWTRGSDGNWNRVGGPPTKAEQAAINKANFVNDGWTPSPYGPGKRVLTEAEKNLQQAAAWKQWQKTMSGFGVSATKLAESAASMAFSGKFKLANYLGSYDTVEERRAYLHEAGIDPDAAHGRNLLNMARLEYARRTGKSANSWSSIRDSSYYDKHIRGERLAQYGMWSGRPQAIIGHSTMRLDRGDGPEDIAYSWRAGTAPGSNYRAARISDKAGDGIWGSQQDYVDKGFSTEGLPDVTKGAVGNVAISGAIKGLQMLGDAAEKTGKQLKDIWGEAQHQVKGIYSASEYFVPGPFKGGTRRITDSLLQATDAKATKFNGYMEGIGQIAQGKLITGAGTIAKTKVHSWGMGIQSQINMWAGITDLIIAPFKMIGGVAKWLYNNLRLFGTGLLNIVGQFNQLGLPLTMLTGVHYRDMQRSYVADSMIGANKGTTNGIYESFAGAQQDLYTFGKLDEHRLISAAMLGVFNDVYAYGGNTQAQYGSMVNNIYRQLQNASPSGQQRIMNLARGIDDTLPARLQQMKNLGISDYTQIQDGSWIKGRGINQYTATDAQRARYTAAGMEYTALKESMSETKNIIAERLWRAIGKPALSGLNDIFYALANGGSWRQALASVKEKAKELWANISKEFGLNPDFGGFLSGVGDKLKEMIWGVVPTVANVVAETVSLIGKGYAALIEATQPLINRFLTELSTTRIDVGIDSHGLKFEVSTNNTRKRDYLEDQAANGYHQANSWAAAPISALALYGDTWEGLKGRAGAELREHESQYYKAVYGIEGSPLADEFDRMLKGENFSDWNEAKAWYAKKFTEKYLAGAYSAQRLMDIDDLADLQREAEKSPKVRGRLMYSVDPEGWDAKDTGIYTRQNAHDLATNFITATEQLASTIKASIPDLAEALMKMSDGIKMTLNLEQNGKTAAEIEASSNGRVAVKAVDLQSVHVIDKTLTIFTGGYAQ